MIRSLQDLIIQHSRTINSLNKDTTSKGLSLKKGDIISGKVLDYNRSGQSKLLVNGIKLSAQTSVQLSKGQVAQFRVEQTQPNYIFKVFTGSGMQSSALQLMGSAMQSSSPFQILQNLFQMIEKNSDLSKQKGLMQLSQMLSQLAIKSGDSITPYYLMAFIHRSGLLWENKLKYLLSNQKDIKHDKFKKLLQQDLKGLALQAHKNVPDEYMDVKLNLEELIHQIKQWQLLNHKALSESGKIYFMLPLLFGNIFQTGELLIDVSDARKGQKEPSESMLKASLLLKMSQLGPLKVEAVLFQRQLRIDFWLVDEKTISLFKQNETIISKSLNIHGIHIQMVAYHKTDKKEFEDMSLIQDILRSSQHLNTFA